MVRHLAPGEEVHINVNGDAMEQVERATVASADLVQDAAKYPLLAISGNVAD